MEADANDTPARETPGGYKKSTQLGVGVGAFLVLALLVLNTYIRVSNESEDPQQVAGGEPTAEPRRQTGGNESLTRILDEAARVDRPEIAERNVPGQDDYLGIRDLNRELSIENPLHRSLDDNYGRDDDVELLALEDPIRPEDDQHRRSQNDDPDVRAANDLLANTRVAGPVDPRVDEIRGVQQRLLDLADEDSNGSAGIEGPFEPEPLSKGCVIPPGTTARALLSQNISNEATQRFTAYVEENIYDVRGIQICIPAGTRLLGDVEPPSETTDRLQATVSRLVLPPLPLADSQAVDRTIVEIKNPIQVTGLDGYAGIPGEVNRHTFKKIKASFLRLIGEAPKYAVDSGEAQSTQDEATRDLTDRLSTQVQEGTEPTLSLAATTQVSAGTVFNLMFDEPLYLDSYAPVYGLRSLSSGI